MTRLHRIFMGVVTATVLAAGPGACKAANLFGLVDTGELFRSTDGGSTWSAIGTLPIRNAVGLAAGATSTELYLASGSGGIYRSVNGGVSWDAVGSVTAPDVAALVITPDGNLVVVTRTGAIHASSDQGATFVPIGVIPGSDWVSLVRGPLGRLYAVTTRGQIAESQDNGGTWVTVGLIATSEAVAIQRLGAALYVIARTGEVYRSIDYGVGWVPVGTVSQGSVGALADLGSELVAVTSEGEVATSADGTAWTWVGAINQLRVTALGSDAPQATGVADSETSPRFTAGIPRPNPSQGTNRVTFSFSLASPGHVRLDVYDVRGRLVSAGPSGAFEAGPGVIRWSPPPLAGGTYIVRMSTDSGHRATTKWTVLQ